MFNCPPLAIIIRSHGRHSSAIWSHRSTTRILVPSAFSFLNTLRAHPPVPRRQASSTPLTANSPAPEPVDTPTTSGPASEALSSKTLPEDTSPQPALRVKQAIVLNETDLEESFVKGSGPGGQKINKCRHRVQLKHVPTGIMVESQRFRELAANRKEARKLLRLKLDEMINGDLSRRAQQISKEQKRKKRQAQKSKKKYGKCEVEEGEVDLEGNAARQEEGTRKESET
ncbi:uncharacterized protein SPPG_06963 [Spizellomyces punctatus DAOM BR117]|uniref:Prokaryotic-type class I peptide chain release factors domain-containing protein n=1 Tax=Spizellomyces punctatus (strain DAOM BR117) TaxID=645134 RepID=A0A0L0HAP9_SPIPD|nr:uncharacterized protein SPPG_06963 [Spizellomyces punctatus DAOM BR117]KNC97974.1 hypothetical protein SPPG_06963 [Spizellomyces punctatus DAOM BR117]|eukprot:XP_016606014.1 hypothetical protein SPPG_06963 [Spizellomyces punctatus DAOM BR117]